MQRFLLGVSLLAPALLVMPPAGRAQPAPGPYVGGGLGANFLESERFRSVTVGGHNFGGDGSVGFDAGWAGVASVGWGFGNGVRLELEGSFRTNNGPVPPGGVSSEYETKYGAMANVMFDLDVGSPYVFPYLGAGAGTQWATYRLRPAIPAAPSGWYATGNQDSANVNFAYQAVAGLAFPIQGVPGLSVTAEYRYLGVNGERKESGTVLVPGHPARPYSVTISDDDNHSLLLGVRYAFNVPPPPAAPAAVPAAVAAAAPAPAPAPTRSYLVFFDWDSAALTGRARQVIAAAARNAAAVPVTRIEVAGHADRSGTAAINQDLSRRRAEVVAAELVKQGVARQAIAIQAFGASKPLVASDAGVREPQNRRVEIVLH